MRAIATVLLVTVLLSVPCFVHAHTWYIKADGTGDAPTIQTGIDMAAVGDTVMVAPGTYAGAGNKDLDFGGKDIVLLGEGGPEVTIIDCEGSGRGLYFHSGESPAAVVQGLTIERGNVGTDYGGGMFCDSSSPTVTNCTFSENSGGSFGGGMYCFDYSSPTVIGCTFSENSATTLGGGMYCTRSCSPTVTGCAFSGNSSGASGGGMYCSYSSSPTVTDCSFSGNSATTDGGGMYCVYDSSPTVTDCTFSGNSTTAPASYGGGMYCSYDTSPTVTGCTFSGNSAPGPVSCGGGMYCSGSSPIVTNCTFSGNSAPQGGGMYCHANSSPMLENTIIAFSTQGAAVYCSGGSATLTCCDVYGNAGGDWVGCIADQYGINGNISEDPLFCGEANYPGDPFRLDIASPCVVSNSPCGELIGARPAGCSEGVSVERTTWGRVKAAYR